MRLADTSLLRRVYQQSSEEQSFRTPSQAKYTPDQLSKLLFQKKSVSRATPKNKRLPRPPSSNRAKLQSKYVCANNSDNIMERWMIHRCEPSSAKMSRFPSHSRAEQKPARVASKITFSGRGLVQAPNQPFISDRKAVKKQIKRMSPPSLNEFESNHTVSMR